MFVAEKEMVLQPGGWAGGKNPHTGKDLACNKISQTVSEFCQFVCMTYECEEGTQNFVHGISGQFENIKYDLPLDFNVTS
jgi:hypothetical protein